MCCVVCIVCSVFVHQKIFVTGADRILSESSSLFSDALEEFCEIPAIRQRFEAWLTQYPEDYQKAFVNMTIPTVIAPFVQRDMLRWNPLVSGGSGAAALASAEWLVALTGFGKSVPATEAHHVAGTDENDPDKVCHWHDRCAVLLCIADFLCICLVILTRVLSIRPLHQTACAHNTTHHTS